MTQRICSGYCETSNFPASSVDEGKLPGVHHPPILAPFAVTLDNSFLVNAKLHYQQPCRPSRRGMTLMVGSYHNMITKRRYRKSNRMSPAEVDSCPLRTAAANQERSQPGRNPKKRGLRLSWPHAGDRRRSVVGKSPSTRQGNRDPPVQDTRIVHVSHRDVELHYHFTSSVLKSKPPRF